MTTLNLNVLTEQDQTSRHPSVWSYKDDSHENIFRLLSYRLLRSVSLADVAQSIMSDISEVDSLPGHPHTEGGFLIDPHVPHPEARSCRIGESYITTSTWSTKLSHVMFSELYQENWSPIRSRSLISSGLPERRTFSKMCEPANS